jgi:hypothetical protein
MVLEGERREAKEDSRESSSEAVGYQLILSVSSESGHEAESEYERPSQADDDGGMDRESLSSEGLDADEHDERDDHTREAREEREDSQANPTDVHESQVIDASVGLVREPSPTQPLASPTQGQASQGAVTSPRSTKRLAKSGKKDEKSKSDKEEKEKAKKEERERKEREEKERKEKREREEREEKERKERERKEKEGGRTHLFGGLMSGAPKRRTEERREDGPRSNEVTLNLKPRPMPPKAEPKEEAKEEAKEDTPQADPNEGQTTVQPGDD